jgi:hypothetical protein|tara:strand:+ start:219 stop:422 length:204 start_codon:yes stop_codon:yes gene_type:complete
MEDKVLEILERNFNESIEFDRNKATEELLILFGVSKCYTEKDMDNAYDKGFKDGNQRDLTGSLIEVL